MAVALWATLMLTLVGVAELDKKVTELDNTSLLLKEISELTIENQHKGTTIINQAELIESMADSCYFE